MALFEQIRRIGYQVEFCAHAEAILNQDFPSLAAELDQVLSTFQVDATELLEGGGGESRPTQRLRRALADEGWTKHTFTITKAVDGEPREATSHEIDHVKKHGRYNLALEIEWNNKDTFFDRDLENFKRLHSETAISIGFILTRGESFQSSLKQVLLDLCVERGLNCIEALAAAKVQQRTGRQQQRIVQLIESGKSFEEAFVKTFVDDKYGEATTHWRKLQEKVKRGAGGSCPLVLLGFPRDIIRP